jgi:hypothetical protein
MRATSFDFIDRVAKSYRRPHGGLLQSPAWRPPTIARMSASYMGFD